MLNVLPLLLINLLGHIFPFQSQPVTTMPILKWEKASIFALPTEPDVQVETLINNYLQELSTQGINPKQQGIWVQSEWAELANYQGNIPLSAASLTKIVTSLAALATWGQNYRFETRFYRTGIVKNGELQGDLIIEGNGDPLLVWEEAIAIGATLNKLGIKKVSGNLMIIGDLAFNFKSDPQMVGAWIKQSFNADNWSSEIEKQYQSLTIKMPRPHIAIQGQIQVNNNLPANAQLILRHQSLSLVELLRQMNIYSNNVMAEMLAQKLGGAAKIDEIVTKMTGVTEGEIQLVNGSGLGVANRISPQAVCAMLMTIEQQFASQGVKVTDLFPVGGRDDTGTMRWRHIPDGVGIKTGTLAQVSALAGVIPTQERGLVWFAIINGGSSNIEGFRNQQDKVLQQLARHWTLTQATDNSLSQSPILGDPRRHIIEQYQF